MQSRKVHWRFLERSSQNWQQNWQQTQCRVASLYFRLLHRLPTTSVLSHPSRLWGRDRICSSPRRRRRRPAAPGLPPGGLSEPQSPGARRLSQRAPLMMATPRAISQVDHVPTETHISNISQNQKSVSTGLGSHSCAPITTCSTFKPISLLRFPPSSSTCSRLWGSTCSKRRTAPTLPSSAACRMCPPQSRNSGCLAVFGSPRFIHNILYQWIGHNVIIVYICIVFAACAFLNLVHSTTNKY